VIASAKSLQWSGSGAEHLDGSVSGSLMVAREIGQRLSRAARVRFRASMDTHAHQAGERRVSDVRARADFVGVEGLVVVLGRQAYRGMIRLKRLQDDFTWLLGATRTAGNLCE